MIVKAELLGRIRERIGKPTQNEVSDRRLMDYLHSRLEWLAGLLEYSVKTDSTSIAAVASQYEYALPADFGEMIWVRYGGEFLTPATVPQWVRDGTDWIDAAAALPTEYAIQARKLLVTPPPSSTNVTSYPKFTISYVASPVPVEENDLPLFGESDQMLLVFAVAHEWCSANPTEENLVRAQAYQQYIDLQLAEARRRRFFASEEFAPQIHVFTRRRGAAR